MAETGSMCIVELVSRNVLYRDMAWSDSVKALQGVPSPKYIGV
jgi:hypothetical protein